MMILQSFMAAEPPYLKNIQDEVCQKEVERDEEDETNRVKHRRLSPMSTFNQNTSR